MFRGGTGGTAARAAACNQVVNGILITGMNRLSPMIVRRAGPRAAAVPLRRPEPVTIETAAAWLDDLKLFATGWVGGLIFFGTLLG